MTTDAYASLGVDHYHSQDPNTATPRRGTRSEHGMPTPRPHSKLLGDKQPFKFGVDSLYSTTIMASSSAPLNVFDEHRFRKEFNPQLFESHARKRKVIPEVGFNLDKGEYPQIMEQILLRGWRRLAAPMTGVSKLLVQEFYANAAVSDEEVANED
ncbi:hypothetical protein PIB30_106851 [Stylosanthes scabra]|uniref:Uncharacterized protein n=1 Tax=Stylosanthes scabra TaxID=79078 RepID=A0ABU6T1C1_9FABA|nr:hypothetical protein [Stylosanthes scabra]